MKISNNAVGEVVSTLLTLTIVLGVVAAVLAWGIPYIEEKEIRGETQAVFAGFDVMYDTMSGLIVDGYGSKGFSNIVSSNDQASLNIDSKGKKLILIYAFDDGNSFDFNVSGLDDENETFTIEGDLTLNRVQIYWLDPGKTTQQYAFETSPYRKIYQDSWCAQSFTPPVDNWNLDKIKIYVAERGVVTSDLNVSIYNSTGNNLPDVNDSYASSVISKDDISSSFEWIEWDIDPDIQLDGSKTYHIGINTSGGSFGGGSYNYYKWCLSKDSPYNSSFYDANVTVNNGDKWTSISDYDFEYRLNFTDNVPPNAPLLNLPTPPIRSGVSENYNALATDNDDDKISYKIFWGDGEFKESSLVDNNTDYDVSHTYAKPGTYTITLQVKDINGTIYEGDNITEISVGTGDYLPEDRYYSESPIKNGANPIWTIEATKPLNGTLRIDLFGGGSWTDIPFGRIWVFDLGSITYESRNDIGSQITIFQNGGILTFGPINNGIKSHPSFFEEDEAIGFRIIQIGESYVKGVGGSGVYEIGLNMKNSYSREPRVTEEESQYSQIYNFKMQIYDPFEEATELWINYFTTSYDFERIVDRPNTIYYTENGKHFVLDSSFIEVNIEGLR